MPINYIAVDQQRVSRSLNTRLPDGPTSLLCVPRHACTLTGGDPGGGGARAPVDL